MSEDSKRSVPDPVDVHVGKRIRERREFLGISQTHLSEAIGLRYQQVQKYEKGTNRISASKLFALSTLLSVPVSYFFDGLYAASTDRWLSMGDPTLEAFRRTEHARPLVEAFLNMPPETRKDFVSAAKTAPIKHENRLTHV